MKPTIPLLLAAAILAPTVAFGQVLVNDSWADGGRNNGADPLDADWWTSTSSQGIEVSVGSLGLVTGPTSGRGIHATFAPQTLAIGETLRATFTFRTPATIGSAGSGALRVGLMDLNNPGLAANLSASSTSPQPLYIGLPGYMVDFDVNYGPTSDTSVREHNLTSTSGRLLGTTAEWDQLGTGPDEGYSFLANTEYVGVMSVTRTGADSMNVFGSLSQGGALLTSNMESDTSGIVNHIGMLGFYANSAMFGSSGTPGAADNGIDFSNVQVELIVPEPSSGALLLAGMLILGRSLKRRSNP